MMRKCVVWGIVIGVLVVAVVVFFPWARSTAEETGRTAEPKGDAKARATPAAIREAGEARPAKKAGAPGLREFPAEAAGAGRTPPRQDAILREYRDDLTRALATDGARTALDFSKRADAEDRRLAQQVRQADAALGIQAYFDEAGPNWEFYADDWAELRGRAHKQERKAVLYDYLERIADGDDASSPTALRAVVRSAQRQLEEMRERNRELADRLRVITNLVRNHRQKEAAAPSPLVPPGAPTHAEPAPESRFQVAHREADQPEPAGATAGEAHPAPGPRVPVWTRRANAVLDRYQQGR